MASYFWVAVGGVATGSWDNVLTTHWSTSSGGSAGAGPPTSADSVTFDTNSGTGTVTIASTAACASLAFGGSGVTTLFSGGVTFGTVTVTAGTFTTGANTHSFTSFTSTSGTRTLTLTNSTINITGTSGTPWNVSATGLTWAAPATINITGGAVNTALNLTLSNLTYNAFNITGPGQWNLGNTQTYSAFSYTSTSDKRDRLFLGGGTVTIAAGGSLTLAGNSVVNRAFVTSGTLGTQKSFSVPNTATVTLTNVDFQDINMTGTFSTGATASSIGDALGNTFGWSSVQPDPSVSPSLTGTGAINWSTAAIWSTGKVPLPQDDVTINYAGGSATTLTADMPRLGRNISFAGYTKILSRSGSVRLALFGNLTLSASMTFTGGGNTDLYGRGSQTLDCAGNTYPDSVTLFAFGGTYALLSDWNNTNGAFAFANGTFTAATYNVTSSVFQPQSNVGVTLNMGSGNWNASAGSGSAWSVFGSAVTINSQTSTITFTGTAAGNITFGGLGKTYNAFNWSSTASTGTLIITGANTFNTQFTSNNTTARTIQFPNGVTQTFGAGAFQVSGRSGFLISLTSSTPGSVATLSCPSGRINSDYLNISDSAATGGAQWFAGQNSVNTTPATTTGWLFTSFLAISGGGQLLLRGVGG